MMFLLAESRFESEDYPGAISAYEKVAYEYPVHKRGADAGYSAIVGYEWELANITAEQLIPTSNTGHINK